MSEMKVHASAVALIGDLVGSRRSPDRQHLHDTVTEALARTNAQVTAIDPLVITVGDEFQALYPTLGDAVRAAYVLRLSLTEVDVRFGLGRGEARTLDPERGIHDGSAFWNARDAIVAVEEQAEHARTRTARTAYRSTTDAPGHVDAVTVALECLDFVVGSASDISRAILGGLMDGRTQAEIGAGLGISASAVSQRVRRDGLGVAEDALSRLGGLP